MAQGGGEMTPQERAEKIFRDYNYGHAAELSHEAKGYVAEIATQISEAEREAYENGKRDSIIEFCEGDRSLLAEYEQTAYAAGFRAARDKAAEIVRETHKYCGPGPLCEIAQRIQDMQP